MYKEVLIESIKDAQNLPSDTIAYRYGGVRGPREVVVKRDDSRWQSLSRDSYTDLDMIGWIALKEVYDGFIL